jgi:RHS repeat-associated protein
MLVGVDALVRRVRWSVSLLGLALAVSLLPAVEVPRPAKVPGTPAAVAGPGPVERPLPPEARSNRAAAKRSPVEPPGVKAAGPPRMLSAAERAQASKSGGLGALDGGPGDPVFEDLVLRPGFTLGDTSLVVYFELHNDDRSFASWTVKLFDAAAETEQASTTLTPAELEPTCDTVRKFCKAFGAAQGWVLDPAKEYFVTITATFADGREVVSAKSDNAKPRTTIVPPPISGGQAAGCGCGNALGLTEGGQAIRAQGVNTATGAFSRVERDLSMASFGVEFASVRTYSSALVNPGPFGPGWAWSYGMRATTTDEGVIVRAEDGAEAFYRLADNGTFTRPAGVRSNLRRAGDGFELVTRSQMVYGFDGGGRLVSVLNPRRIGVRLAYTDWGVSITDASGRVVKVSVDAGLIRRVELPDGRYVEFGYDGGRLTSVRDARGNTWRYKYSTVGLLTEVVSPIRVGRPPKNVIDVHNEYDATGHVVKQLDALGKVTEFKFDPQETRTTDPDGVQIFDGYRGNVLVYSQRGTKDTVNHRYDGSLNRNLVVNGKHNQHESAFDNAGNLTQRKAPLPFAFDEVVKYDERNNPIEYKDARGNVWKNTFNEFNDLVESTDAENHKIRYEYNDPRGLLTIQIDQRNKVTRYEYLPVGDRNSGLLRAVISPEARRTEFAYDGTGRQTTVVDPRGTVPGANRDAFTTRTGYDDADQVTEVSQPGKREPWRTGYDEAGRVNRRVTPTGIETRYTYFDNGMVRSITDPRQELQFTYTAAGRKASARVKMDPGPDLVTTYAYNAKGLLEKVTSPRGNVPGAVAANFTTTYFYDANDNLVRLRRPYPRPPGFVDKDVRTDELDRTTSTVDDGRTTSFGRDNAGNVTSATDSLGRTTKLEYDKNNRQTSTTDNGRNATGFVYDEAGNKIKQTMPEGGVTTWQYDGDGLLIATTEPRGNVPGGTPDRFTTRYRYDRAGNAQETIDPLGHSTIFSYDANNRLVAATDAKGRTTRYTYDDDDRTRSVHAADAPFDADRPEDNSTVFDYHGDGLLKSVRDPNGHTTRMDYDQAGRLSARTDPLGRRTEVSYDAEGNVVSMITLAKDEKPSAASRAKRTMVDTYDIVGRRTKRELGTGGPVYNWEYDAKDRTTFYGDPAGKREVEYDDEDQIRKVTRTDNSGQVEVFGYEYDERGNIKLRIYPDGTRIESDYDKDSRLTTLTARGGAAGANPAVWQMGYDIAGHRTRTTLPAATGLVETRGYDDAGRLTSVATTRPAAATQRAPAPGAGTASPAGDNAAGPAGDGPVAPANNDRRPGAPTNVPAQAGAAQASVSWKPPSDTGSAPLTGYVVTASPGGRTVEAAPDATGAVVNGLDPGIAYTFTVTASNKIGAGPASKPSLPVTPVTLPQNPVSAFQLDLDELGNPTRVVTTRGGVSESVAYAYDKVDRVTAACYGATTCSGHAAGRVDYRYDLVGNRTSQTLSGSAGSGVTTYEYDEADQLTRRTTRGAGPTAVVDYGYDLLGNQTKVGNDKFEYNLDNSLAKATVSGRTTTYNYDATGLRLSATTGSGGQATTQRWSWDVNGTLPEIALDSVTDAAGAVVDKRGFVYSPDDEPLALLDPATGAHAYTHDWLGGVANMVSPAGVPEQGYDYDPYGNPRMGDTLKAPGATNLGIASGGQSTATSQGAAQGGTGPANPLQYAGAYQDSSSGNGNYYLRARNYNAGSGRFTATDPEPRSGAAMSAYAYADGNPLTLTDPTGMMPLADGGGGGGSGTQSDPPATGPQPDPGPSEEDIAKANQLQNKSLLDVVLEAGGQILMEILGINDIIDCLKGDIGACVMTVVGALPWGKIFKAKKIAEALWRAGKAIFKFFEELKWARAILRGAEKAAEAAKAAAAAAAKAAADKAAAIKAAAERAAKKAAEEASERAKALAAKAKAATKKGSAKADDAADEVGTSCPTSISIPHSFVAGTPVTLADGTTKPIEKVEPGDTVLASDQNAVGKQANGSQVTHAIRTDDDREFVDLTVDGSGGEHTVTTTEHHPFWSATRERWVDAGDLQPGELLRTAAGTYVKIGAVRRYKGERVTYDLTVDTNHTYYVVAGDTPVLVHNCGGSVGGHNPSCTCASGGTPSGPINAGLAGSNHPVTGVPFDAQGFPDFSAWRHPSVNDVRIQLTGSRRRDFRAANAAAGLRRTPTGYTWHHHQDCGLMQLVERSVHSATGHTGGFSIC